VELVTRAVLYILKTYQVQLKQDAAVLPIMKSISTHLKAEFKGIRDTIGTNQCALKMISKEIMAKKQMDQDLDFDRPDAGFEF